MTVTFPTGTTELVIPVSTTEDEVAELSEDFTALLSDPSDGLSVGAQNVATVNIMDDEGERCPLPLHDQFKGVGRRVLQNPLSI